MTRNDRYGLSACLLLLLPPVVVPFLLIDEPDATAVDVVLSVADVDVDGLDASVFDGPFAVFGALIDVSRTCAGSGKYGAVGVVGVREPPLVSGAEYS